MQYVHTSISLQETICGSLKANPVQNPSSVNICQQKKVKEPDRPIEKVPLSQIHTKSPIPEERTQLHTQPPIPEARTYSPQLAYPQLWEFILTYLLIYRFYSPTIHTKSPYKN